MCSPQKISQHCKLMNNKSLSVSRLADKPTMPTGLKSIRKISMSGFDQPSKCSDKVRSSPKVRRRSVSTPRRNGSNGKHSRLRRKHMSEKTWERNTTGLAAYTHQRKEQ